jgi:CheY-like chemotaxis protein
MDRKILIVDDNPNMSSLLAEMLEVFDYNSIRATNGEEAVHLVEENDIDLVITDMRMPKMSGLDLLQVIKEKKPKLPVVVISGYALDEEGDSLLSELADGFLSKPFKMAEIEDLLDRVIQ